MWAAHRSPSKERYVSLRRQGWSSMAGSAGGRSASKDCAPNATEHAMTLPSSLWAERGVRQGGPRPCRIPREAHEPCTATTDKAVCWGGMHGDGDNINCAPAASIIAVNIAVNDVAEGIGAVPPGREGEVIVGGRHGLIG